jgi:hypothetical protein
LNSYNGDPNAKEFGVTFENKLTTIKDPYVKELATISRQWQGERILPKYSDGILAVIFFQDRSIHHI